MSYSLRTACTTSGIATSEEIHQRWEFKRQMKEQGLDEESRHTVEEYYAMLNAAGFAETAVVWRTFSITILAASTWSVG